MADEFSLAQLTKDMVVSRLQDSPDAPAMAAEIAKKTIVAAIRGTQYAGQDPHETVRQVCFGAMSGLLLIEKDIPRGTVKILECLADVSQELAMDPSQMMTWAMESVAKLSRLVPMQVRWKIREAVEETYLGTGEVFDALCDKLDPK